MNLEGQSTLLIDLRQRLADLPLRIKALLGLGVLVTGLILVGAVATYTGLRFRQIVSRTLTQQRQLADRAANINNTVADIQNSAFEFYYSWTIHGFEREVSEAGFDYAREIYLTPMQEQLEQVRQDISAIQKLEPAADTIPTLERIRENVDIYETTLLSMSDRMERLGFRTSGEMGLTIAALAELELRLNQAGLEALNSTLIRADKHVKDYFVSSNLVSSRLARELIHQLEEQIEDADDTQLSSAEKAESLALLTQYDDHFLAAMSHKRNLQDIQPQLIGQSGLITVLVSKLFEQQQTDFDATLDQLKSQQSNSVATTIVVAFVALLGAPAIAYLIITQFIRPIQLLGEASEQLGAGDLDVRAPIYSRDEIGTTAGAFNLMADRLQELLAGLEQEVAERTRDLRTTSADLAARTVELEQAHEQQMEINRQLQEAMRQSQRRAELLQASAEVSRAAAQIRDVDTLLSQATQLISQHFGFYHAGIFLIDEASRYAVLRATNSEGGKQMLARRHKLEVGAEGIVGNVTGTGQSRIALDVGGDAFFFNNPDLPRTRSEMAVPLRIGNEVIGALDVQSTQEAAFNQEDVTVLTALADQIAIAIQNARLFQQSQEALEDAQRAQQRYLQQQWSQFTRERPSLVYEYTLSGVQSAADTSSPIAEEAWKKSELIVHNSTIDDQTTDLTRAALAVPIQIHGETIGVLDLEETEDDHTWTEDEIALVQAVTDQLGQALEEARLFEQTQASLTETQTLFQTSRNLAAAQQIEEIWQAVIEAASQRRADACALFLFDTQERETARDLVLTSGWAHPDTPLEIPTGTRLPLSDFGVFGFLQADQSFSIADLDQSERLDDATRTFLSSLNFSAVHLQPISVRGNWFGLLAILYQSSHAFTQAEIGFYRTLADQAALAFEGQRLLVETQRRAERERLIRQISDRVRATPDLETILQTTVQELSRAMGFPRAFIRLGTDEFGAESLRMLKKKDKESTK